MTPAPVLAEVQTPARVNSGTMIISGVCVTVYKVLTALFASELALPEEIPKYVRFAQYQFKDFKNINCFMSLHRHQLDNAGTLLSHNSSMQS